MSLAVPADEGLPAVEFLRTVPPESGFIRRPVQLESVSRHADSGDAHVHSGEVALAMVADGSPWRAPPFLLEAVCTMDAVPRARAGVFPNRRPS